MKTRKQADRPALRAGPFLVASRERLGASPEAVVRHLLERCLATASGRVSDVAISAVGGAIVLVCRDNAVELPKNGA
jgi:hypothetical protein